MIIRRWLMFSPPQSGSPGGMKSEACSKYATCPNKLKAVP